MNEVRQRGGAEGGAISAFTSSAHSAGFREELSSTLVVAGRTASGHRLALSEPQDMFAVCEVNERRALELVMRNLKPAFLIIDLALPGLGRVRGVREIRRFSPDTRIIALADLPHNDEGLLALKAGALGYCASTISSGELRKAINVIGKGEIWASRELVREMVAELVSVADRLSREGSEVPAHSRLESLTKRQRVVAKLISSGASNKEIGNRLNISERTVKAHLTEAFRTVGVTDRLGLALLFQAHPSLGND
jgi:two-component system nitrate/nitrite response regulator NarL